jgi:hypothetical protein
MKRLLILPLLGMLFVGPAAQAEVIAQIEITDARLTTAGGVRVEGEVTCPAGYEVRRNRAELFQIDGKVPAEAEVVRHFRGQVRCRGSADTFTVRFGPDFLGEIDVEQPLQVSLMFTACRAEGTNGETCVTATDISTVLLEQPTTP